ncbi:hypothetical protein CPB84DRAFT_1763343 [Gymnopilus junonius]|uniref:Uncharacterized protein n=1 Tax=Gymnopilus junonius TaxID=109634 RepID=A0A9P5NWQ2_GYMJU|nr:hypothetical protein CPB84DRAFT_1763343 [Gymnopilus junonius]
MSILWLDFEDFLHEEELKFVVEFLKKDTRSGQGCYVSCIAYVCSRRGSGGTKLYARIHPEWTQKVPSKTTDHTALHLAQ